jgi:hypothetical protein
MMAMVTPGVQQRPQSAAGLKLTQALWRRLCFASSVLRQFEPQRITQATQLPG